MKKYEEIQKTYREGLEFALKIAKEMGVDELEKEVRYRTQHAVPLNVNWRELSACVRNVEKGEVRILATAGCMTMAEDLKLPPSQVLKYLRGLNTRVEQYRLDTDLFEKDCKRMDENFALNSVCKAFMEEDKEQ